MLPSIHKEASQGNPYRNNHKPRKGGSSPSKKKAGAGQLKPLSPSRQPSVLESQDGGVQEAVAWRGRDLLAQVLQLRPAEEEQVTAMVKQYTQFLRSQISSDAAYSRALEKEHMERSTHVFRLQKHLEDVQGTLKVCSAPAPKSVAGGRAQELLDQHDHNIQRLEEEVAAVRSQATTGKQAAGYALREERAINLELNAEVLSLQAAAKQRVKELKQVQAQLRRTQVAIAQKHPQLGIYDAVALEEELWAESGGDDGQDGGLEGEASQHAAASSSSGRRPSPPRAARHGSPAKGRQGSPLKNRVRGEQQGGVKAERSAAGSVAAERSSHVMGAGIRQGIKAEHGGIVEESSEGVGVGVYASYQIHAEPSSSGAAPQRAGHHQQQPSHAAHQQHQQCGRQHGAHAEHVGANGDPQTETDSAEARVVLCLVVDDP